VRWCNVDGNQKQRSENQQIQDKKGSPLQINERGLFAKSDFRAKQGL
jgi:hypothetical protein